MDGSRGSTLCDPTRPPHTLTGVIRGSDRAGLASQDRSGTPQQIREKTEKDAYRGLKKEVRWKCDAGMRITAELSNSLIGGAG